MLLIVGNYKNVGLFCNINSGHIDVKDNPTEC